MLKKLRLCNKIKTSLNFVGTSISLAGGARSGIYLFLAVLTARSTVLTFEHKG